MAQISESDIGKRVTIRLKAGTGYRDIVGQLLTTTTLRNRHGQVLEFDPTEIHIWREIIEQPRGAKSGAPLSLRIAQLERVLTLTWQPQELSETAGYLLRSDSGTTRRANSALAINQKLALQDQSIVQLIDWYRERAKTPTVLLIPRIQQELVEQLSRAGFSDGLSLLVMVKDLKPNPDNEALGFTNHLDTKLSSSTLPTSEWLEVHDDQRNLELLNRGEAMYLTLRSGEALSAIGRIAFAEDWAVLSRIWVDPKVRGKSLGRQMVKSLEAIAATKLNKLALQVNVENQSAISLYKSLGYEVHHEALFKELLPQRDLTPTASH